jgi:hypothetical protein
VALPRFFEENFRFTRGAGGAITTGMVRENWMSIMASWDDMGFLPATYEQFQTKWDNMVRRYKVRAHASLFACLICHVFESLTVHVVLFVVQALKLLQNTTGEGQCALWEPFAIFDGHAAFGERKDLEAPATMLNEAGGRVLFEKPKPKLKQESKTDNEEVEEIDMTKDTPPRSAGKPKRMTDRELQQESMQLQGKMMEGIVGSMIAFMKDSNTSMLGAIRELVSSSSPPAAQVQVPFFVPSPQTQISSPPPLEPFGVARVSSVVALGLSPAETEVLPATRPVHRPRTLNLPPRPSGPFPSIFDLTVTPPPSQ